MAVKESGVAFIENTYDGLNRRLEKVDKTGDTDVEYSYYYNTDWQIVEVRKDGAASPYKQFVWCLRYIDAPVLRWRDTNTDGTVDDTLYYTNDANMNITALVNTSGDVVERYSYDPYGRVTFRKADLSLQEVDGHDDGTVSAYANAILYAGYLYDDETGLFHVRNRTYHPTLGRWLQRDPLGYVDGMSLYEYVRSAPTHYVDWSGADADSTTRPVNATDMELFDLVLNMQTYPMVDPNTGLVMGPIETMPDEVLENIAKENQANLDAAVLSKIAKGPTGTWKEVLKDLGKGTTADGRSYYDVFVDAYQIAHKYIWMYSTTVEHKYKVQCCWFSDRPCDSDDETVEVRMWGELLVGLYQFRKKGASVVSRFEGLDSDCKYGFGSSEPGFSTGAIGRHEAALEVGECVCGSHVSCITWRGCRTEVRDNVRFLIPKAERYAKSQFQGVNKHHMFQVKLGQHIVNKRGKIELGRGPLEIYIGEAAGRES